MNCKKIQNHLIENFYNEGVLKEEEVEHISQCLECSRFKNYLKNTLFSNDTEKKSISSSLWKAEIAIQKAWVEADHLKQKRKSFIDFLLFMGTCLSILFTAFFVIDKGYSVILLGTQVFFMGIFPLILPILFYNRNKSIETIPNSRKKEPRV